MMCVIREHNETENASLVPSQIVWKVFENLPYVCVCV